MIANKWSVSFNWPSASHEPGDSGKEKRGWASLHLMEAQAWLFLCESQRYLAGVTLRSETLPYSRHNLTAEVNY